MTTLIYRHDIFGDHRTPEGHPERSGRYGAVAAAIEHPAFADLTRRAPPKASAEQVALVHPDSYVANIEASAPSQGMAALDADTFMSSATLEAAQRAAGGAAAAVDAVFAGEADNAFIAARPPGHHAEPNRAMGFCVFNSVAIGAMHARAVHGAQRVAVVDFDVHHGNGTELAFWDDEDAFFGSSHEFPQYPGTGRKTDRGASFNVVNAPLPNGADGEAFRRAWGEDILPALADFRPEIILISAGFDAHHADPLGGLTLTEADFAWVTREIQAVARQVCAGRVVSILEGGYDLAALQQCVVAHLAALADRDAEVGA